MSACRAPDQSPWGLVAAGVPGAGELAVVVRSPTPPRGPLSTVAGFARIRSHACVDATAAAAMRSCSRSLAREARRRACASVGAGCRLRSGDDVNTASAGGHIVLVEQLRRRRLVGAMS